VMVVLDSPGTIDLLSSARRWWIQSQVFIMIYTSIWSN
jgi:hypothetical protein